MAVHPVGNASVTLRLMLDVPRDRLEGMLLKHEELDRSDEEAVVRVLEQAVAEQGTYDLLNYVTGETVEVMI